jgi:hypothetical protein
VRGVGGGRGGIGGGLPGSGTGLGCARCTRPPGGVRAGRAGRAVRGGTDCIELAVPVGAGSVVDCVAGSPAVARVARCGKVRPRACGQFGECSGLGRVGGRG